MVLSQSDVISATPVDLTLPPAGDTYDPAADADRLPDEAQSSPRESICHCGTGSVRSMSQPRPGDSHDLFTGGQGQIFWRRERFCPLLPAG